MGSKHPLPSPQFFFRTDINGLRALAVIGVLFFHFHFTYLPGGFAGVDIFFVISGYLMTRIIIQGHERGNFSLPGFYTARFARIVPALAVMVLAMLIVGWIFVDPIAYEAIGLQSAASLIFVSNILFFFTSGYFAPTSADLWLLHTWSLSVEWQFYIVYPIAMALVYRLAPSHAGPFVIGSFAIAFVVPLGLTQIGGTRMASFLFYMFPSRAWEMLLGGCVFVTRLKTPAPKILIESLGLILIAMSFLALTEATPWPGFATLLPTLGTAMVIAADRGKDGGLQHEILQRVGDWSYSVYLWHWPLLVALRYTGLTSWPLLVAGFVTSFMLGYLSFVAIETPARKLVRAMQGRRLASGLAYAGCAAVAMASAGVYMAGGVEARAQPTERPIIADAEQARQDWTFPNGSCDGLDQSGAVRVCKLGPETDRRTLVIGDSHAQMWYPRFAALAESSRASIDFATMAGCPPVSGLGKIGQPKCGPFNQAVLKLADDPAYNKVMIIANWVGFLDYEKPLNTVCVIRDAACKRINDVATFEAARTLIGQTVARLKRQGRRIVVVLPGPILPFSGPDRIARDAFNGFDLQIYGNLPRSMLINDRHGVGAFLLGLADGDTVLADPNRAWCSGETCRIVGPDLHVLYKDDNHIRSSVAQQLSVLDNSSLISNLDSSDSGHEGG
ncbi:acyltransferase [Rhizobium sp. CG5]|uniref:acyltransferase family protein n=1 Tax=Rhizobium sp. CG5 TaxID=2726076 RepID=UPI002033DB56|nr:acyltransferase family protein [Rhizobium sp. CG5]MCM2473324.1 acyltransferase [Rhizobium sp. CG5]